MWVWHADKRFTRPISLHLCRLKRQGQDPDRISSLPPPFPSQQRHKEYEVTCEGGRTGNWHHVPLLGGGRTQHSAQRRGPGDSRPAQTLPAPPPNSGTRPTSGAEGPPPPGRPRGRRRAWAAARAPARPSPPAAHLPLPPCLRGPYRGPAPPPHLAASTELVPGPAVLSGGEEGKEQGKGQGRRDQGREEAVRPRRRRAPPGWGSEEGGDDRDATTASANAEERLRRPQPGRK